MNDTQLMTNNALQKNNGAPNKAHKGMQRNKTSNRRPAPASRGARIASWQQRMHLLFARQLY